MYVKIRHWGIISNSMWVKYEWKHESDRSNVDMVGGQ